MKFYSTNRKSEPVTFLKAAETGLAPDGGLYMPQTVPKLSLPYDIIPSETLPDLQELSIKAATPFLEDSLSEGEIENLIRDAITMDAPLIKLNDELFVLELFHGPTLAFKDFGARFMARLFSNHRSESDKDLVILVATSGDTGGAVASGFYGLDGVHVCLLYPKGKVSDVQRKQMTTLGSNITALEINGTFDDCQKLVKQAFSDDELNQILRLSSANSINVARLLPQSFYYLSAYFQLKKYSVSDPVFVVPSGNFGNLTAGIMAAKMGMPVAGFVAATNRNDVVPEYLKGEEFLPRISVQTISNAMDVGNPSNFDRIRALYDFDDDAIRKDIKGYSFSDEETRVMIREIFDRYEYVADPHTAVGLLAAEHFKRDYKPHHPAIVLSTAHPAKFPDVVEDEIKQDVEVPERLKKASGSNEKSMPLSADFHEFRDILIETYRQ